MAPPRRGPGGGTCQMGACARAAAPRTRAQQACGMSCSSQERRRGSARGRGVGCLSCQHGARARKPLCGRTWRAPARSARQRSPNARRKTPPAAVRAMPKATRLLRLPAPDEERSYSDDEGRRFLCLVPVFLGGGLVSCSTVGLACSDGITHAGFGRDLRQMLIGNISVGRRMGQAASIHWFCCW